jgi:carboxylesterase type B
MTAFCVFAFHRHQFHGSELAFVFDFVLGLWTGGEKQLAKAFGTYWTTFAATGVPGGEGLPVWPAFDVSTLLTAVLDVDSVLTPVSMLKEPVCSMWDVTRIPDNLIWG